MNKKHTSFILLLIFGTQPIKSASIYDRLKKSTHSAYDAYRRQPVLYRVAILTLATSSVVGLAHAYLKYAAKQKEQEENEALLKEFYEKQAGLSPRSRERQQMEQQENAKRIRKIYLESMLEGIGSYRSGPDSAPTDDHIKYAYHMLELRGNPDEATVRTAFHALSRRCHPDKNSSPEAALEYKAITGAYQILKDANKAK